MKVDKLVILSVALCLVVLAGEVMAYGPNIHDFDADADLEKDPIEYSVTSSGSNVYSVVAMDNGNFTAPRILYIYNDPGYSDHYDLVNEHIQFSGVDQGYAMDQVTKSLKVRGFDDVRVVDDKGLLDALKSDILNNVPAALLTFSYALPESVYSGSADDLLLRWIEAGGSLYWATSPAGMYYRSDSGIVKVADHQELLFGRECMKLTGDDIAYNVIEKDGLTNALGIKWNRTLYGLDISGIEGARSLGFEQDGYSSISMIPRGEGMICIFGGDYNRSISDDISQIIASGLSCHTRSVSVEEGSVTRGTVNGTIDIANEGNLCVYIVIGGYYTVYGRSFHSV